MLEYLKEMLEYPPIRLFVIVTGLALLVFFGYELGLAV